MNKFEKLGLSEELLKSINELGFEKPTPIQENIIPVILEGYDVIGQAQTGTGKTLAFSSILLTNLKERKKKPQAYILSPTRELTMQIHEELKKDYGIVFDDINVIEPSEQTIIMKPISDTKSGNNSYMYDKQKLIQHE